MGFPIQLKSKEVKIGNEKMSQMIVKEKLSERAVMKENGLRRVCLQGRRITPKQKELSESDHQVQEQDADNL